VNTDKLKLWIKFYGNLSLIAAWNGVLRFFYAATGAAAASSASLVDLKSISIKDFGWLLLGTVITSIFGELYKHPLPIPQEPNI